MTSWAASSAWSFAAAGSSLHFGSALGVGRGMGEGLGVGVAGASVTVGAGDAVARLVSEATRREPGPEQATRPAVRTRAMRRATKENGRGLMMKVCWHGSVR